MTNLRKETVLEGIDCSLLNLRKPPEDTECPGCGTPLSQTPGYGCYNCGFNTNADCY